MAENILGGSGAIEAEIAQLQKLIEQKRNLLEQEHGIVEEKELVRSAVEGLLSAEGGISLGQATQSTDDDSGSDQAQSIPKVVAADKSVKGGSYLDHLDDSSATTINAFIQQIPQAGIIKTVNQVIAESPFVVDAFHDALVDKLYEELKAQGIVK